MPSEANFPILGNDEFKRRLILEGEELRKELKVAIEAALTAGKAIMKIYENEDFQTGFKEDESPLTIADKKANDLINDFLIPTGIPVISEENKQQPYKERKNWKRCWIVDPLDGTKEFIKRNGEFTVNIALIENGNPRLGVIFAPAIQDIYFADVSQKKAYKQKITGDEVIREILEKAQELEPSTLGEVIKVVGSRSHMNEDTLHYVQELKERSSKEIEVVSRGSSLKFCLVAEGQAHVYPRFAPTMEWDTAAGQAICEAVGLKVICRETGRSISYNRPSMLNMHFLVSNGR